MVLFKTMRTRSRENNNRQSTAISGGRGDLIYHTCVGSGLGPFLGSKFLISFFFWGGGGQKNEYFFGYEDFVDIFGGHHKIGLYLGVIFCIFGSFLKVKVQI